MSILIWSLAQLCDLSGWKGKYDMKKNLNWYFRQSLGTLTSKPCVHLPIINLKGNTPVYTYYNDRLFRSMANSVGQILGIPNNTLNLKKNPVNILFGIYSFSHVKIVWSWKKFHHSKFIKNEDYHWFSMEVWVIFVVRLLITWLVNVTWKNTHGRITVSVIVQHVPSLKIICLSPKDENIFEFSCLVCNYAGHESHSKVSAWVHFSKGVTFCYWIF